MQPTSLTPQEIKLVKLKKTFSEVFSEGIFDWKKLKAILRDDYSIEFKAT